MKAPIHCAECNSTDWTPRQPTQRFCSTPCRKTFNNRRMTRGAELYDLFMALRYDRKWSAAVGMWQMMCRLVSEWREEDQARQRASYIKPEKWVTENKASLTATKYGKVA